MVVVRINNEKINHKDGLIYADNLNETLDSCIIAIENIEKLEIEPLDAIDVTFPDDSRKGFIVASYDEQVASYNPPLYNYQIQVASPALLTERITAPNLAITKVYREENDENYLIQEGEYYVRSVLYYVEQFLTEYTSNYNIRLNDKILRDKLASIKCPEMQFERPTIREVMQELFSVADLIFTLERDFTYDYIVYEIKSLDVNKVGNEINRYKLDSDITRNSVNVYASNLDVEMQQTINNKSTSTVQMMSLRSDEGILTTENAKLILDNNIYSITKLELNLDFYTLNLNEFSPNYSLGWISLPVVEKSVYDTLPIGNESELDKGTDYKNNTFYYSQGSNTIEGFGKTYRNWIGFEGLGWKYVVKNILKGLPYPNLDDNTIKQYMSYIEDNLMNLLFKVTYIPMTDAKMQVERTKQIKHNSILFDNQEAKLININTFAKYEIDKLNRISNQERTITAVYTNYNDIPKLADYIDDYILTNREISIYDNYIVFKGILTKDFANRYQYNAINSKKRFFNITNENLIRHEIIKKYFVFSYQQKQSESNLDYLLNFENKKISHVILSHKFYNNDTQLLLKESVTANAGNSILISFGYDNNILGGYSVGNQVTGGYSINGVRYVDKYGENIETNFYFFNEPKDVIETGNSYINSSWLRSSKLPDVKEYGLEAYGLENIVFNAKSNHHKDQAEIQKWTLQLLFVSNDNDILIGEGFYKYNSFVSSIYEVWDNVKIVVKNEKFTIKDTINCEYDYELNSDDYEVNVLNNFLRINLSNITDKINIAVLYNDEPLFILNNYESNKPVYVALSDTRN